MIDPPRAGGSSTAAVAEEAARRAEAARQAAIEAARKAAIEAARRAAEERARLLAAEQARDQIVEAPQTGPFAVTSAVPSAVTASASSAADYSVTELTRLVQAGAPIEGAGQPAGPGPDDETAAELREWVAEWVYPDEVGSILDGSHPEIQDVVLPSGGLPEAYQQVVLDAALDRWIPADVFGFQALVWSIAAVDDPELLGHAADALWQRSVSSEKIPGALTTQDYAAAAAQVAAADPSVAEQFVSGLGADLPEFVAAMGLDDRLLAAETNVDRRNDAALALLASVAQDPVAVPLAGQYLAHMDAAAIGGSALLAQVLEPAFGEGTETLLALPEVFEDASPLQVVGAFAPYAGALSLDDARLYAERPDLYLAQLQGLDLVGRIQVADVPSGMALELPASATELFPVLRSAELPGGLPADVASRWREGQPTMADLTLLIEQGFLDPADMISQVQGVYGAVERLSPMSVASNPIEVVAAGIIEISGGIDALDYAQSAAGHLSEQFGADLAALDGADPERQAEILYGALLKHQAASESLMPMYAGLVAQEGSEFLGNYYATLKVAADITTEIGTYVFAAAALSAGVPPAASTAAFRAGVSVIFEAAFQQAEQGSLDAGSLLQVGAGNFVQGYFAALPIGQSGKAATWAASHLQRLPPRSAAIVGELFAGVFASTSAQSGAILGSWIEDPSLLPQNAQEQREVLVALTAAAASGLIVQGPLTTLLERSGFPALGSAIGEVEQELLQNILTSTAENMAAGMPFEEALAAAASLENNASSILIAAVLGTVTSGADEDSQVLLVARAQASVDRLAASGQPVLPSTLAELETRLGISPGTLEAPPAFDGEPVSSAEIDATLAALGLQDDAAFRAALEKIVRLQDAGMSLANVGSVQAAAASLLAQEYGVDITVVGRLADDPAAIEARRGAVALADAIVAELGIPGVTTLAQLKEDFGPYPAGVIQQAVATSLRNEGVMIEAWQVKESTGGSEVDAIVPREQWAALDARQRLELGAAMQRIFGVAEVDWYQDIPLLSAQAGAEQWAAAGIEVETLVSSLAAATGLSVEQARAIVALPANGIYLQPPGTPTFNAVEFYSNGDVIHPNLAGADTVGPDGSLRSRRR